MDATKAGAGADGMNGADRGTVANGSDGIPDNGMDADGVSRIDSRRSAGVEVDRSDNGTVAGVDGVMADGRTDPGRASGAADRLGRDPVAQDESAYVQQHLANERTFLAWIRTGIAIVGVGFLSAGIVFHASPFHRLGQVVASVVAIGAVLFGGSIFAMATTGYLRKRKGINRESFRSARLAVWGVFAGLCLLSALLFVLVILLLM